MLDLSEVAKRMRRANRTEGLSGGMVAWAAALALVLPSAGMAGEVQRFGDWQVVAGTDAAGRPSGSVAETQAIKDSRPDGEQRARLVVGADHRGVELQIDAGAPSPVRVAYRAVEIRLGSSPAGAVTGLLHTGGKRLVLYGQIEPSASKRVIERFVEGLKRSDTLQLRITDPEDLRQRVLTFSLKGSSAALEAIGY
jgi:hypothetical protein